MGLKSCSWCGHDVLEPGFMLDNGGARYGQWVRGPLEIGIMGNAKVIGRDRVAVRAFRCVQCSHLELFAPSDPNS